LVWEALEEEERVYELECSRSRVKLTLCRGGSSLKFVTIKFNVLHYASTREEGGRKRKIKREIQDRQSAIARESLLRITTL